MGDLRHSTRQLRVAVLGDHTLTRAGLCALLGTQDEIDQVDAFAQPAAAVAGALGADALIVACSSATEAVNATTALFVDYGRVPPVLVVAPESSPAFVRGAFAAGASGVITTAAAVDELIGALHAIVGGASYLHPSLGALLAQLDTARIIDELSPREREVLRMIALGMTNPEIAESLVVSVRTVETHRSHLSRKLRAHTRAELVRHALDNGLLASALS